MYAAGSRQYVVPAVVGVLALVAALVLGYVTVRDSPGASGTETTAAATEVDTRRIVSTRGGFAVAVPVGLTVERAGGSVRLSSRAKDLAIVVAPAGHGPLAAAEDGVLDRMRPGYRRFTRLGADPAEVDGQPARTTYGHAVNDTGARLRFLVLTIHVGSRNYAVAAYTAFDSDPAVILPRVNAVANGFEALPPRR
jgi:hypothetical protein